MTVAPLPSSLVTSHHRHHRILVTVTVTTLALTALALLAVLSVDLVDLPLGGAGHGMATATAAVVDRLSLTVTFAVIAGLGVSMALTSAHWMSQDGEPELHDVR